MTRQQHDDDDDDDDDYGNDHGDVLKFRVWNLISQFIHTSNDFW